MNCHSINRLYNLHEAVTVLMVQDTRGSMWSSCCSVAEYRMVVLVGTHWPAVLACVCCTACWVPVLSCCRPERARQARLLNVDGFEVLKVNNYDTETGGISAWEETGGERRQLQHRTRQQLQLSLGGS